MGAIALALQGLACKPKIDDDVFIEQGQSNKSGVAKHIVSYAGTDNGFGIKYYLSP
jgi:hypothetical protein